MKFVQFNVTIWLIWSLTKATEKRNICSSSSERIAAMERQVKHIVFPKQVSRTTNAPLPFDELINHHLLRHIH